MKKLTILFLLLIPAIVFGKLSNKVLTNAANTVNKTTPYMVDKETRLDSVVGINDTFTYFYTLVNYTSKQLNAKKLEASLKPSITKNACSQPAMAVFFKNGVTINYNYKGKDGGFVLNISITPATCGY